MTKLARVQSGIVAEFLTPLEDFVLEDCFPAGLLAQCVPAADTVQIGWLYDGNSFSAPPPTPLPGMADLVAYAADLRWRREVGGITIGGVPVATDDRSKMMILGARVAAAANPGWETVWHGSDGETYPLNAAQMIAISDAVEAHVNSTFSTFAVVKADVEAGDITTTAEIDAAFA
jgi:hypothetical protein